ncbi:hypothetical protein MRX96_027893 [Rhipicephalus microplus]
MKARRAATANQPCHPDTAFLDPIADVYSTAKHHPPVLSLFVVILPLPSAPSGRLRNRLETRRGLDLRIKTNGILLQTLHSLTTIDNAVTRTAADRVSHPYHYRRSLGPHSSGANGRHALKAVEGSSSKSSPLRAPAPLWTPRPLPLNRSGGGPESTKQFAVMAVAMGTSCGGSVPYRPREPNPRIPRKESKTPASHMHLPPFLAAVSSKPPIKSPSPNTATRVEGPPRAAAFKTKDFASTVPLPFPLRAAVAANEGCASPALPKKIETSGTNSRTSQGFSGGGGKSKAARGGNMTARRSNNGGGVRESEMLGAKPKKAPRLNNMTFTKSSERSSGNSSYNSGNKAFSRTPPLRNSPRVYSSTVLKDFNSPSKQDNDRAEERRLRRRAADIIPDIGFWSSSTESRK